MNLYLGFEYRSLYANFLLDDSAIFHQNYKSKRKNTQNEMLVLLNI